MLHMHGVLLEPLLSMFTCVYNLSLPLYQSCNAYFSSFALSWISHCSEFHNMKGSNHLFLAQVTFLSQQFSFMTPLSSWHQPGTLPLLNNGALVGLYFMLTLHNRNVLIGCLLNCSEDLLSVSEYYSSELITYVRRVLEIIPVSLAYFRSFLSRLLIDACLLLGVLEGFTIKVILCR